MTLSNWLERWDRLNSSTIKITNFLAVWILVAMMFLTFIDVVLRYFLNSPLPGSSELIEFMMVIMIPLSIAYCAQEKEHIAVRFILDFFPESVQKVFECFTRSLMLVLALLITWQSFLFVYDQYRKYITSSVLYIPVHPFASVFAIAFLLLTSILAAQTASYISEVVTKWTRS